MFDNTPLELEEIIDQCRALASTSFEMKQPEAKESLSFMIAGTHGDIAPPLLSAGCGKGLWMMFSAGL